MATDMDRDALAGNADRVGSCSIDSAFAVRRYGAAVEREDVQPGWSGTFLAVRGSEVVEERSVGPSAGPDSPPCTPRSRFQACSISKLVVSTVVLSLVESGTLHLQQPITTWLDDLPSTWPTITLHQLLSNTSGLGHWGDVPGLPRLLTAPPPVDELLALIADAPLVEPPGAGWRYSGPGFLIAARTVEAVTGQPYAAIADDLVFTPAAMQSTTSGPPLPTGADATIGHDRGRPWPPHPNFATITGSGDLWTTTGDLIRLGQALRTGQLLPTRSASQLWSPHTTLPAAPANPGPMVVTAYGYGMFLGRILGHRARINPGDNPGYQSLLAYLPDRDIDLAVLCNEEAPSLDAALAELRLP